MRTVWFSSAILAVAALFAVGCEEDDPPGTMTGQFPSQPGQDSGTLPQFDAAVPGVDAGGSINPIGGGADSGQVGPRLDAGGTGGMSASDATVVGDARAPEGGAQSDGAAPSEAGPAPGGWSPCPGGGMPCKILPLGDSITVGLGYAGGYRVELFRQARVANQNITFTGTAMANGPTMVEGATFPRANEGHSGWTVSQVDGLVPSPALNMKPNIVLLMIGTNDVTFGAAVPASVGMLVDKLISADPNMLIVVAQITPRGGFFGGATVADPATEAFNAGLPAEVQKRASMGKHVLLVDMYNGFPMNGLGDVVHPNKQGYDWMAGVWYKAISPYLR